jgi:hypothetical protein
LATVRAQLARPASASAPYSSSYRLRPHACPHVGTRQIEARPLQSWRLQELPAQSWIFPCVM